MGESTTSGITADMKVGSAAARKFQRVNEILAENNNEPTQLIKILQEIQAEYRYLPEEILTYVATALGQSPSHVFGVATFYGQFSLKPKGKYEIRVCDGTACHVRGGIKVLEAIRKRLNLDNSKTTTPDMRFSLETVSCLGACALSPVVVINGKVYPQETPEGIVRVIDEIDAAEEAHK